MKHKELSLEQAKKAWNDARQKTIEAISVFAKENIGKIILFNDTDTYTKLRYTKEKGTELYRGRGMQYWVSINENPNYFLSPAPTNSTLAYLLEQFIQGKYDICIPSQENKRIRTYVGGDKQYTYTDYEPKDYEYWNDEKIAEINELFLTNIKKCNIKGEQDPDPDFKGYYTYKIVFPQNKTIDYTRLVLTTGSDFLVNKKADGIYMRTFIENGIEKVYYVDFTNTKKGESYAINYINQRQSRFIAKSLEKILKNIK